MGDWTHFTLHYSDDNRKNFHIRSTRSRDVFHEQTFNFDGNYVALREESEEGRKKRDPGTSSWNFVSR